MGLASRHQICATQVRSLQTGLFRDISFAWLQLNAADSDWPDRSHLAVKHCMTWGFTGNEHRYLMKQASCCGCCVMRSALFPCVALDWVTGRREQGKAPKMAMTKHTSAGIEQTKAACCKMENGAQLVSTCQKTSSLKCGMASQ